MNLYLVRHGKPVADYESGDPPLSSEGESEVALVASKLSEMDVNVDEIYHSGKLRAEQTAGIIQKSVAPDVELSFREGLKPNDPVAGIADDMNAAEQNTMLVGHLPFMDKIAAFLLDRSHDKSGLAFRTATVVCFERSENDKWALLWTVSPDDVNDRKG